MCPSATPRSLGGASWANAGVDVTRAMHPARARSRRFMSGLRSRTRLHEVDVDPGRRRAYGLDYADAPEADLDLGPRWSRNTCTEFDHGRAGPGSSRGPGPRARCGSTSPAAGTAGRTSCGQAGDLG